MYTVPDLRVSAVSPRDSSVARLPPSLLTGSPGKHSPVFNQYYEAATTTLRFSPPPFVGWGPIPRADFPLRSRPPGNRGRIGQGVLCRLTPCRYLRPRTHTVLTSSHGTPVHLCPVLRPRSVFHAKPLRRVGGAPASREYEGTGVAILSRLNHTALMLAVYASCRHL